MKIFLFCIFIILSSCKQLNKGSTTYDINADSPRVGLSVSGDTVVLSNITQTDSLFIDYVNNIKIPKRIYPDIKIIQTDSRDRFILDTIIFEIENDNRNLLINKKLIKRSKVPFEDYDIDSMSIYINYNESNYYTYDEFLIVKSSSQNWTGLMSSFSFYQIINLKELYVLEFISFGDQIDILGKTREGNITCLLSESTDYDPVDESWTVLIKQLDLKTLSPVAIEVINEQHQLKCNTLKLIFPFR